MFKWRLQFRMVSSGIAAVMRPDSLPHSLTVISRLFQRNPEARDNIETRVQMMDIWP